MNFTAVGGCQASSVLRAVQASVGRGRALIDLAGMTWVSPAAMVAICAFAERAVRTGRKVDFVPPRNSDVANYLDRMNLSRLLDELGVSHGLRKVRRHNVGNQLLEVRRFTSTSGAAELAAHIHDATAQFDPKAAKALYKCLVTAGENVEHSGQRSGFLAAQKTHGGKRLFFAVGDSGRGFFSSLEDQGAESDSHALKLATTGGVSATGQKGRGYGLRDLSSHLQAMKGTLVMISGDAFRMEYPGSVSERSGSHRFRGSLIEGYVPIRS